MFATPAPRPTSAVGLKPLSTWAGASCTFQLLARLSHIRLAKFTPLPRAKASDPLFPSVTSASATATGPAPIFCSAGAFDRDEGLVAKRPEDAGHRSRRNPASSVDDVESSEQRGA